MPKRPVGGGEPVELARVAPFLDCMGVLRPGLDDDWWSGIFSTRMVVYGSGRIGLAGEKANHRFDRDELALCRSLAKKTGKIGGGPMSSESGFDYTEFALPIALGEPVPGRIDEALIRERFGGTILPVAKIDIQPLDESSGWWSDMVTLIRNVDASNDANRRKLDVEPWMERALTLARALAERGLTSADQVKDKAEREDADTGTVRPLLRQLALNRFLSGPEFRDSAYVAIGDDDRVPEKNWPSGLEMWPSQFPRLFLGLTQKGSLAGLVSYVVLT